MSYTIPHYYPKYEILWDDDYLAKGPFNNQHHHHNLTDFLLKYKSGLTETFPGASIFQLSSRPLRRCLFQFAQYELDQPTSKQANKRSRLFSGGTVQCGGRGTRVQQNRTSSPASGEYILYLKAWNWKRNASSWTISIAGVSGATLHWASKECWSLLSWGLVSYLSEAATLGLVIIIVMSDMQLCMVGWTKMSRQPTPLSLSTFSSCFRLEVKSQLCAKSIQANSCVRTLVSSCLAIWQILVRSHTTKHNISQLHFTENARDRFFFRLTYFPPPCWHGWQ